MYTIKLKNITSFLCFIVTTKLLKCNDTVFVTTNINMVNGYKITCFRPWSYLWGCFPTDKIMVLFTGWYNFLGFPVSKRFFFPQLNINQTFYQFSPYHILCFSYFCLSIEIVCTGWCLYRYLCDLPGLFGKTDE